MKKLVKDFFFQFLLTVSKKMLLSDVIFFFFFYIQNMQICQSCHIKKKKEKTICLMDYDPCMTVYIFIYEYNIIIYVPVTK